MQERLNRLSHDYDLPEAPSNLYFIFSYRTFPKLNDGGLELIDDFIKKDPLIKSVIIDTFGSAIKNDGKRYGYGFQHDYELGSSIQEIAMQNQVSFILLHHTRKMKSGDPYEDIVGTTGLTASPDTLLVLVSRAIKTSQSGPPKPATCFN
jgi:RecA-family ATPase